MKQQLHYVHLRKVGGKRDLNEFDREMTADASSVGTSISIMAALVKF